MATQSISSKEPHIAEELLARAHSAENASTIFREKYERLQKTKAGRRSHKPRPLSAKQKRILGVHQIPPAQRRFAIYEPLHALWCGYMREILGVSAAVAEGGAAAGGGRTFVDGNFAGPLLTSADYHGAAVEVVRSRCVSRVGVQGIVVKDNRFSFEIITKHNQLKIVPKEHTTFAFEVPFEEVKEGEQRKPLRFEIHGSQFSIRAPERATKKFRQHFDPDL